MVHVLGAAAMGVLFLAILLLLIGDWRQAASGQMQGHAHALEGMASESTTQEHVPEMSAAVAAQPLAAHAVANEIKTPLPLPKSTPTPLAPRAPFRPARNIYVVQAPPPPPPKSDGDEPIGTPIPVTETEFSRAVEYEKVLREQGEIPTATPLASESQAMDATPGDPHDFLPGPAKPPPPPPKE